MVLSVGRLSTLQLNLTNRRHVSTTTTALESAGREVSTGRRADIFKDLGPRAAAALKLRSNEEDTQAYLLSNGVLGNKLQAMLTSTDSIRERTQAVLESALGNASRPVNGADTLQEQARAALESIVATLNTSYNGDHIFAGIESNEAPMTRWSETNPETGLSPKDVLEGIVGSGPTSVADVQAMTAEIDAIFDSSNTVNPERNYEGTYFSGSPLQDGSGNPTNRVTARISPGQALDYGVQANDQGFRDIIKGLSMLASTDVAQIDDPEAYEAFMSHVIDALSAGQEGALDTSARIGFNQQVVETAVTRLTDLSLVQRTQIANYETVDPYEAVTRMTSLENQLQASYQVSARLSNLSILNYL
ncbi:MAG: flagellar hook protein [Rhodobacteraceae bacterium]|nr:flagellar hook protein [Paracoccaceae bacterium]